MRKTLLFALIIMLATAPAALFAWDSLYESGDFNVSITASYLFPLGVALYPGAEMILAQVKVADEIPLDFGAAARGQIGFNRVGTYLGTNYGYTTFGAGAFGTAHLSFADMGDHALEFLKNFDFYISLGVAFNYFTYTGDWFGADTQNFRIGAASFEGVNWYINESLALKLEYVYWGYMGSSATIGVQLTL